MVTEIVTEMVTEILPSRPANTNKQDSVRVSISICTSPRTLLCSNPRYSRICDRMALVGHIFRPRRHVTTELYQLIVQRLAESSPRGTYLLQNANFVFAEEVKIQRSSSSFHNCCFWKTSSPLYRQDSVINVTLHRGKHANTH